MPAIASILSGPPARARSFGYTIFNGWSEMWDLDALAADGATDGVYEFWLTAAPLPVTGAVGAPVNPSAVK